MVRFSGRRFLVGAVLVALVGVLACEVVAETEATATKPWSRNGKGELFLAVQQMGEDSTTGLGVDLCLDKTTLGGFGLGINFSDHLNFNTTLLFGSTDMTGSSGFGTVEIDLTTVVWDFNLDYNIFKERITPVVSGGLGFIRYANTDDNVGETDFSYNVGGGVRWDISKSCMLKVLYKATWTTLEDADSKVMLDGVSAVLAWMM